MNTTDNDGRNVYSDPTLREMIDAAKEAAAGPGRYVNPMAYVIDCYCDPTGDDEVSCGLGGDYAVRYGRRILLITSSGFAEAIRYRNAEQAKLSIDRLRSKYAG